jgi:competence CoiA-like predicted nuclease
VKVDRAIHIITKEEVSAYKINMDSSYQEPLNNEWVAPIRDIINWDDIKDNFKNGIKVIYIKDKVVTNKYDTKYFVSPHFRIPNKKRLGIQTIPESKEHKQAKNWIFNKIKNDDLILWHSKIKRPEKYIQKIKLSELWLDYNSLQFEAHIEGGLTKIIDCKILFHKKHPLLGYGIAFEIQFSNQQKKTTKKRTRDYALMGLSTCWIYYEDIEIISDTQIKYKSDKIRVDSWLTTLNDIDKTLMRDLKIETQYQSRLLDSKYKSIKNELTKHIRQEMKQVGCDIVRQIEESGDYYLSETNKLLKNIEKPLEKVNKIYSNFTDYDIIIKEKFGKLFLKANEVSNLLTTPLSVLGECKKCNNGYLMFKSAQFGDFYGCSEYPSCTHTVKIFKRGEK